MRLQIIYSIYMYKQDLALNNLQGLMCNNPPHTQGLFKKFHDLPRFLLYLSPFVWVSPAQKLRRKIWISFSIFIGLVRRVFTNGPGDLASIPGRVIPKTLKMVLDTSLLNTQQYKVCVKVKVEQCRERSSAFPYTLVC